MCTVTFIPGENGIYITSNRDERTQRKPAIPPRIEQMGNAAVLFPRDGDAGGSWIGMHQNGNAAVLLNGAFISHIPKPPYTKSRGLVFLDTLSAVSPHKFFVRIPLEGIEPFTIILYESEYLFECRWDGRDKHLVQFPVYQPMIWSSVTLYDNPVIQKREEWFHAFLGKNPDPTREQIMAFHLFGGDGDSRNDLHMKREDTYLTVSITGMELQKSMGSMQYKDLVKGTDHFQELSIFSTSKAL